MHHEARRSVAMTETQMMLEAWSTSCGPSPCLASVASLPRSSILRNVGLRLTRFGRHRNAAVGGPIIQHPPPAKPHQPFDEGRPFPVLTRLLVWLARLEEGHVGPREQSHGISPIEQRLAGGVRVGRNGQIAVDRAVPRIV